MLQYLLISWIFLLCMQLFVSFHVYSRTMMNTPVLHRSLKLSNIGFSKYLDGWPLKKFPRDCRLFTVAGRPYRNSTVYGRISEIKIPNTAVYRQTSSSLPRFYRVRNNFGIENAEYGRVPAVSRLPFFYRSTGFSSENLPTWSYTLPRGRKSEENPVERQQPGRKVLFHTCRSHAGIGKKTEENPEETRKKPGRKC